MFDFLRRILFKPISMKRLRTKHNVRDDTTEITGMASDKRLMPESLYVVTFDDESVTNTHPDGTVETVKWADLGAVIVETNDTGPLGIDVMWLLLARDMKSGCVIPQGATGEDKLIVRLQALPGFDNEMLIEAMCSVANKRFLCWKTREHDKNTTVSTHD